ncbi:MAG: hypothetical protein JXR10_06035 [Cyclobacteriaceae bacterium]
MKKLEVISLSIITLLCLTFCEEQEPLELSDGLQVKVGQTCGWCHGTEEMIITYETSSYQYNYACGDSLDVPEFFFATDDEDWIILQQYYASGIFQKERLNSCGVCADGCDYWIRYIDGDYEHEIRFQNPENIQNSATRNVAIRFVERLEALNEDE